MSMLLYMPWCRIDRAYDVGKIAILPFDHKRPVNGIGTGAWSRLCTILDTHRDINGKPVDRAALVQFSGKGLADDLPETEIDAAGDLVTLACFAGVASREYFKPHGRYCNSDCFTFYVQKFDGSDSRRNTTISTRRRDGRSLSGWPLDKVSISVPAHCHAIKQISLDSVLLDALLSQWAVVGDHEWRCWQNSITCFNLANTDSETFREHVEWVLLCSAFEHLLEVKGNNRAKQTACQFDKSVVPTNVIQADSAGRRPNLDNKRKGTSLRYEWMREFYRVRGDFAHGKLVSRQPMTWDSHEHLILGTIAFPLIVKSLLSQARRYQMTDEDTVQIDCFESLANEPAFFNSPGDAKINSDSFWARLCAKRHEEIHSKQFRSDCMKGLAAQEQGGEDQPEESE